MKNSRCRLIIFLAVTAVATSAWAQDRCNFSPAFEQVRSALGGMSPLAATKALHAFAIKPQSPDLCEANALDEALGEREKQLALLASKRGGTINAYAVSRCNVFNAKTAQCQSPNEDGTAHPNLSGGFAPLKVDPADTFDLTSQLPHAKLHAVYLTTLSNALDGKPAKRLATRSSIKAAALAPATVLIAIYKTPGGNVSAWAYRKAVWYF